MAAPTKLKELISSFLYTDDKNLDNVKSNEDNKVEEKTKNDSKCSPTQPRNRQAFYNRVKTFSYATWFAKPNCLSPLHCASYGWENNGIDLLKCVTCQYVLCTQIPKTDNFEQISKHYEQIQASLISGHSKLCPWQVNPSPDLFFNIPFQDHDSANENFESRLISLHKLKRCLPKLQNSVFEKINLNCSKIEELKKRMRSSWKFIDKIGTKLDEKLMDIVMVLLITGWNSRYLFNTVLLACELCKREIGLWNFINLDESENSEDFNNKECEENPDEPPVKKSCLDNLKKTIFDPFDQHRVWCPWICENKLPSCSLKWSDDETDDQDSSLAVLPGWKYFLKLLFISSCNKQVPISRQSMKSFRKLLKDLAEPISGEDDSKEK